MLNYICSQLFISTELNGRASQRSWVRIPFRPEFFSGFNSQLLKLLRDGTFFIGKGGGGWAGARRGGSLVNILEIGEGQTFLIRSRGRVILLFGKENITPYYSTNCNTIQIWS